VAFRLTGTGSRQVGLPVRIPAGWHGGTRIGSQFSDSGSQCRGRGVDATPSPLPPWGSAVCTGPDFRKRKKSRNQIASPNWNRMQRCGIGGEGETGAFKCLTPSTLKPRPPDAGPFFESRSAHHRVALSSATPPTRSKTSGS
jgi:hypothetical protein